MNLKQLEYDICSLVEAELITMSRAREILGIKYMEEMRDIYENYFINKEKKIMELSVKEKELYYFIVNREEVTIKEIKETLSEKHVGALGKLLRYEKIELSRNYNRRDEHNKVIKCYVVKKDK